MLYVLQRQRALGSYALVLSMSLGHKYVLVLDQVGVFQTSCQVDSMPSMSQPYVVLSSPNIPLMRSNISLPASKHVPYGSNSTPPVTCLGMH